MVQVEISARVRISNGDTVRSVDQTIESRTKCVQVLQRGGGFAGMRCFAHQMQLISTDHEASAPLCNALRSVSGVECALPDTP